MAFRAVGAINAGGCSRLRCEVKAISVMIDPALRLSRKMLSAVGLQAAVEQVGVVGALDPGARGVVVVAANVFIQWQMAIHSRISPVFRAQISDRV